MPAGMKDVMKYKLDAQASGFLKHATMSHTLAPRACVVAILLNAIFLMGCSSRLPALKPPNFNPQSASASAMEEYDKNGDGKIDKSELKSAPGINSIKEEVDANGDGAVTANEVADLIQERWLDTKGGIMRVAVEVLYRGKPLDGAIVTLEPEPFLADVLKGASGETDGEGYAPLAMAPEDMPHKNVRSGAAPGLYLVRISKEVDGKELLPAKYNTETTLGMEVAMRASYSPGPCVFRLKK